jgi:hypothetical protein
MFGGVLRLCDGSSEEAGGPLLCSTPIIRPVLLLGEVAARRTGTVRPNGPVARLRGGTYPRAAGTYHGYRAADQ